MKCKELRANGKKCQMEALTGERFCRWHDPNRKSKQIANSKPNVTKSNRKEGPLTLIAGGVSGIGAEVLEDARAEINEAIGKLPPSNVFGRRFLERARGDVQNAVETLFKIG